MAMNGVYSLDRAGLGAQPDAGALDPALQAAKELARSLASLPDDAPEARHPNYSVARALVFTMIDMLEEITSDVDAPDEPSRRRESLRRSSLP